MKGVIVLLNAGLLTFVVWGIIRVLSIAPEWILSCIGVLGFISLVASCIATRKEARERGVSFWYLLKKEGG